jgi:glycosyltransferase involved in cell wall biosynthesis
VQIQTDADQAMGMLPVLAARRVVGITNGLDTSAWDPSSDPHLPHRMRYTPATARKGKAAAKRWLQAHAGLPRDASAPLVAFVGRLTPQKGVDVLLKALYAATGPDALAAHSLQRALPPKVRPRLGTQTHMAPVCMVRTRTWCLCAWCVCAQPLTLATQP